MFDEPISSHNPFTFLSGKKYIMTYKSLPKYCNSFMHVQRSLGISDVKWRMKKLTRRIMLFSYDVWAKTILKKRMKMM